MSSHKAIIKLHDVGVSYDGIVALEHVNLDIYADDFIGVIGPNGGGKSSLVKAIMGTTAYKGSICFDESLRRGNHYKIGYMPQVSQFDMRFPISIREVVLSGLQTEKGFFGRYNAQDKQRADAPLCQKSYDNGFGQLIVNVIPAVLNGYGTTALADCNNSDRLTAVTTKRKQKSIKLFIISFNTRNNIFFSFLRLGQCHNNHLFFQIIGINLLISQQLI